MNDEFTVEVSGNVSLGTTTPQGKLHVSCDPVWVVSSIPKPTHRLKIADMTYICVVGVPNAWVRFWQRALLGWTWEEIND